ncbi:MAG: Ig-like domain-containing protein [Steroidobacteraceae bacterium]|nr:Ig-like domain-containing protein [Steroidobacteraceae bacterium]
MSIAVTPTAPTVAVGATQPLTVTGTYNEGSKAVIAVGLTFVSSEPSVATVGASGVVAGVATGTTTITTTEATSGKSTTTLVTVSEGGGSGCGTTEPTCAPATVIPADNVMIYSDGETVPGFDSCPNWGQATICHGEVTIAGNTSLWYSALNYEGLDWSSNPVNVSSRAKLHIDFWTPDLETVSVSLIGGGQENAVAQVLTTGSWNSVDIDLSAYTAPDLSAIVQIKLESATPGTLYVDNIYFWGTAGGGGGGTTIITFDEVPPPKLTDFGVNGAPPVIANDPAGGANQVLKVFKYATPPPGSEQWAGVTVSTQTVPPDSIPAIPFTATDTKMTVRAYSPAVGVRVRLKVEDASQPGISCETDAITTTAGAWETLTFDFANPGTSPPVGGGATSPLDPSKTYNKISIFSDFGIGNGGSAPLPENRVYYYDDITFLGTGGGGGGGGGGGTAPTNAPATVIPAGSVTIYSDAATVANFDPYPNWGQSPPVTFSEPTIAANKSLLYGWAGPGGLYQGLDWSANPVNVSTKGKLHIDFWSPDITSVKVSIIGGGQENAVTQALTTGSWNSIDIDLSNYTLPDKTAIIQIKLEPATAGSLYVDNIYFWGTAGGGGGGGGGGCTEMGCAGPVTIPVATTNDVFGFIKVGDAIFAQDYIGALEGNGNHGGWAGATTIGAASGGSIGYYNDPLMSTSGQKIDELGWVAGTIDNPGGVPSFFRTFVFTAPASTFAASYMGLYANSPTNGTVDVSGYASIKFKLWGPAEMYQVPGFDPVIEITLAGPAVAGCVATGSGGTEISTTFTANQKIGAGSSYKLSLAGWTVKGVCGTDTAGTAVASVLGKLARVAVTVPGSSFNFTNASGAGQYPTGVNLGPVAFTNN